MIYVKRLDILVNKLSPVRRRREDGPIGQAVLAISGFQVSSWSENTFFFNNMASSSQFLNFFLGSFLCDCFSSIICISSLSICLKFDFCPHCHKALALGEVARNPFLAQLHQTLVTTFPLLSPSALGIGETPLRFPPYSTPPLSFNVPFSSSYLLAGDLPSCGP